MFRRLLGLLKPMRLKAEGPAVFVHIPLGLLVDSVRDLGVDLERERDFCTIETGEVFDHLVGDL